MVEKVRRVPWNTVLSLNRVVLPILLIITYFIFLAILGDWLMETAYPSVGALFVTLLTVAIVFASSLIRGVPRLMKLMMSVIAGIALGLGIISFGIAFLNSGDMAGGVVLIALGTLMAILLVLVRYTWGRHNNSIEAR